MKAIKRNAVILTVMLFICAAVYLNWSYNWKVEDAAGIKDGDVSAMEKGGDESDGAAKENGAAGESGAAKEDGAVMEDENAKEDGNANAKEDGGTEKKTGAETLGNIADEGDAGLYYSVTGSDAAQNDVPANADGDGQESGDAGKFDEYFAQVRLERSQARDEAASTLTAVAEAEGASAETVDGALQAMTRMAEYAVKEAELENLIRAKGFADCVVYLTDDSASVTVACDGGLDEAGAAKIADPIVTNTDYSADQLRVTEIK